MRHSQLSGKSRPAGGSRWDATYFGPACSRIRWAVKPPKRGLFVDFLVAMGTYPGCVCALFQLIHKAGPQDTCG